MFCILIIILHRYKLIIIDNLHLFIHDIYHLFETYLVFTEAAIWEVFFTIGFDYFYRIMTRDEEHLYNYLFLEHLLMVASVFIHSFSGVNHFLVSVFHNLMFSVLLGWRKIQLHDLGYRLAEWTLREMQDVHRIESNVSSDSKVVAFFIYLLIYVRLFLIYFFILRHCEIAKTI